MNGELLRMLSEITEEERRILDGGGVEQALYTARREFVVDSRRLLGRGELISIRTHTRFVPFPTHKHNYIEMMYICRGSITHIIGGARVTLEEGDILLLNQQCRHAIEAAGAGDIGINLMILPEFLDTAISMLEKGNILADFLIGLLGQKAGPGQYLHFGLRGDIRVGNLMENLIYSLVHRQDNEYLINKTTMGLLFMCLLQNARALKEDAPNNYPDVMARSVLQYIDTHYKTASLTELAGQMNQPLSTMSRFIKAQTGATFKELLQRKRFQVALGLMCDTELPVSDIVLAVGYENNSYFHRRFREKYRMSPGEFRKQNRKKPMIFA